MGTQFALLQTALVYNNNHLVSESVNADTITNAQGGTLTYAGPASSTVFSNDNVTLSLPGLGTVYSAYNGAPAPALNPVYLSWDLQALDYVYFGTWAAAPNSDPSNEATYQDVGAAIAGYTTPVGSMPTTGSATYQGTTTGYVIGTPIEYARGVTLFNASLAGTATMNVNFSSGTFTGSLSAMTATDEAVLHNPSTTFAWNTVALSGSITGSTLSGVTTASSAPGTQFSLSSASTGTVVGGFYGPTAQNVGAVWTLQDPKGGGSAIGAIGATIVPSDRRLKRDVRALARRGDGLRLYSYRYLGDRRRFVGVMAQDLLGDPRFSSAVSRMACGLMVVDYQHLGLEADDLPAMQAAGFAAIAAYGEVRAAATV